MTRKEIQAYMAALERIASERAKEAEQIRDRLAESFGLTIREGMRLPSRIAWNPDFRRADEARRIAQNAVNMLKKSRGLVTGAGEG